MRKMQAAARRSLALAAILVAIVCVRGSMESKPLEAGVLEKGLLETGVLETGVRVVALEAARRVDVYIDGQLFTSYIWAETIKKPVLYPLKTSRGTIVTRGYPLDPRPGERVDHPHHVGLWL